MQQARIGRNHVFVSYSHADEEYLKRLRVHLGLLERRNIKIWTDKDIEPGMKWQDEIRSALSKTKVAVLMISTDFLNSDFITKQELPPLLAAAESEGVAILPVLVKPSAFGDLEIEPLSRYQAVNMGRPLVKLKDDAEREEEFVRILHLIRKHMEGAPRPSIAAPAEPSAPVADTSEFDSEPLPLVEALAADLDVMLADPRAQALSIQAVTDEEAAELMLLTEGRNGSLLIELLSNDELPPGLQLDREMQRDLVEQWGFNLPERRGDRFWAIAVNEGEDIDVVEAATVIAGLLEGIFSLPNDEVSVGWQVLEQ